MQPSLDRRHGPPEAPGERLATPASVMGEQHGRAFLLIQRLKTLRRQAETAASRRIASTAIALMLTGSFPGRNNIANQQYGGASSQRVQDRRQVLGADGRAIILFGFFGIERPNAHS
jgi:hypothetical protein